MKAKAEAMQKIPFMNLKSQYEKIKPEIQKAVNAVLDSGNFILGEEVEEFEKEYASFCQSKYCRGVANGTDALTIALKAIGVKTGDLVVTVPNTFIATTEAISLVSGKIEFVDIDPKTHLIDPNKLEEKIKILRAANCPVKAIIAVHLYGQPCDMDSIRQIAQKYDVSIVEDAAQAHGAEYRGKRTGALGDVACFSFYPGKNLGAYGDAGAIVTNSLSTSEKVLMLRNHGRKKKYEHEMEGYNSRLDSLQAAILRVKLRHLDAWTEERIKRARYYEERLKNAPSIVLPDTSPVAKHVFHLYVVRVKDRSSVQRALQDAGIGTGVHYPVPLHLQHAYRYLGHLTGAFPEAERSCSEILSLPLDAEITFDQIDYVCETLLKCIS